MWSWSDQAAAVEHDGVPAASAKKLWRMARAVYLVLGEGIAKHQPKLAEVGVQLHRLLSKGYHHHRRRRRHDGLGAAREHPALAYLSALSSCRSMDPAAAVVHPYPHGAASLSCRSMDPAAAAVCQYHYRPREVEFSCSSTPPHKRRGRRTQRRGPRLQRHSLPEHSSSATVTRMYELMDVADNDDVVVVRELDSATPWAAPAVGVPAPPRPVWITDSPFPAREEDEVEEGAVVDRRADEFITWFHEQLRLQHRPAAAGEHAAASYRIR